MTGRPADAVRRATEAIGLYVQSGDRWGQALPLGTLALARRDRRRGDETPRHARHAVHLAADHPSAFVRATIRTTLGATHQALGHFAEAAGQHERALAEHPANQHTRVRARLGLSDAYRELGGLPRAAEHADTALADARRTGLRLAEIDALTAVAATEGNSALRDRYIRRAWHGRRRTGYWLGAQCLSVVVQRPYRAIPAMHGG